MNFSKEPSLPDPPGRWVQKINAKLHDSDGKSISSSFITDGPILSYVFYMCFWCTIFGIIAPIVVFIYLPIQCTVQVMRYLLSTNSKNNSNFAYDLLHQQNSSTNLELGIVITGCDTGFGKELALYAANELGYTVFAGCLHPQTFWNQNTDTAATSKHGTIVPIVMDVTNSKQVANVVRHIQQWLLHQDDPINDIKNKDTKIKSMSPQTRRVLHALVNNAGVLRGSMIDWSRQGDELSDYQYCMDGTCIIFVVYSDFDYRIRRSTLTSLFADQLSHSEFLWYDPML